jgi:hypothetical protein
MTGHEMAELICSVIMAVGMVIMMVISWKN